MMLTLTMLLASSATIFALLYLRLIPYTLLRAVLKWLLTLLYRVKVIGLDNYAAAGARVVIIANHLSFLDVLLLCAFLPDRFLFALNTYIAQQWWVRPLLSLARVFILDPHNASATRPLIRAMQQDQKCVIFPEGRITTTGAIMKVYEGPGMIADKADALILPIRIQGAQYTFFSRLQSKLKLRLLSQITLTILPPRRLTLDATLKGRARRQVISTQLYDIMTDMMFNSSAYQTTLFQALLDARSTYSSRKTIIEDLERQPLNYRQLIARSFTVGAALADATRVGEAVAILLPNANVTVISFFALQAYSRVAVMLNPTASTAQLTSACQTAQVRQLITSLQFVKVAKLEPVLAALAEIGIVVIYVEQLRSQLSLRDRCQGWLRSFYADSYYRQLNRKVMPRDPAVILFTLGSEGAPKGVVLSHQNIQANRYQITVRLAFTPHDSAFNALPIFHAFGLTVATLVPIFTGIKTFLYPSPLHYRFVPELIYDTNATLTFGTDTFLAGYARCAHPYDFHNVRLVFAGAEKLRESTRTIWLEKFGVRIIEGYGATETAPVIAMNTPMQNKIGSVGRFVPGLEYRLEAVAGISAGGKLLVSGPNIMLGYYLPSHPRQLIAPALGWYDTGDVVRVDAAGFVFLLDRVQRFAKIGGEMVSLGTVELNAQSLWPNYQHAVLTLPDQKKGEQLILITNNAAASRAAFLEFCQQHGVDELQIPHQILCLAELPRLATGKYDYVTLQNWLATQMESGSTELFTPQLS